MGLERVGVRRPGQDTAELWKSTLAHADHMIAFKHEPVAIDVDLAFPDDPARRGHAGHLACLLAPQDVIAVALF
jgi:hypothetical protein